MSINKKSRNDPTVMKDPLFGVLRRDSLRYARPLPLYFRNDTLTVVFWCKDIPGIALRMLSHC